MKEQVKKINWGDGKLIKVKKPNLSILEAVLCPVACNPAEGDPKMEVGTKKKVVPVQLPCNDSVE